MSAKDESHHRQRVELLKKLPQEERLRFLEEQAELGAIDSATFKKLRAEVVKAHVAETPIRRDPK